MLWLLLNLACGPSDPPDARSVLLARHPELLVELELPPRNRDADTADWRPLSERFKLERRGETFDEYSTEHPYSTLYTGHGLSHAPYGMALRDAEGVHMVYHHVSRPEQAMATRWDIRKSDHRVLVRVPTGAPRPEGLEVRYLRAIEREDLLNLDTAGLDEREFAMRSLEPELDARYGVYLPAPATAAWDLKLPPKAQLVLGARLIKPLTRTEDRSDGATLIVEIEVDGAPQIVDTLEIAPGEVRPRRLDLSAWAGQDVRLRLRTEPGETNTRDYVFLNEPRVFTSKEKPKRVVMIFVDTLRADHLGAYGYSRDTSPEIDDWSEDAVVFTQARSVAPWTLPAARSALTGRYPDAWSPDHTLAAQLSSRGFISVALIANAFISTWFDMGTSWTHYDYNYLDSAAQQVDAAISQLSRYPDQDLLMLLHLMDPHVPYQEPEPYLSMWAGERPAWLKGKGMGRDIMRRVDPSEPDQAPVRTWAIDRYDQNLRFVSAELGRLLEALDDDAIVVLYADHGEEFWEHGGAEHGHTLYDELVHVPMILDAPELSGRRVDLPVSLVDIAPTLLDLLGLEDPGAQGRSVLAAARGEAMAPAPIAFGDPLYAANAEGVLHDGHKWINREGRRELYALDSDPDELQDLASERDLSPYPEALGEALGRPAQLVWRISAPGSRRSHSNRSARVVVSHPAGIQAVWKANDPLDDLVDPKIIGGEAVLERHSGEGKLPREWYVMPEGDPLAIRGLTITVYRGEEMIGTATFTDPQPALSHDGEVLLSAGVGTDRFSVTWDVAPGPDEQALPQVRPEVEAQLRELGYVSE